MEELRDLKHIYDVAVDKFNSYKGVDMVLPQSFKEAVTEINSNTISYNQYSAVIETKGVQNGVLSIYLPNQWFYIASYFTDFYNELQNFKKVALKIFSKERLKELNGKALTTEETILVGDLPLSETSKTYLTKFVTDYSWWGGAKTIDRGDFYVSPILSAAKLVNASQSFVADLCALLSNKPDLVRLLAATDEKVAQDDTINQKIYYGCPGSGKSYKVKEITEKVDENFVFRTTFHPDTDYASFVGCYKPISNSRGLLNGNDLTEDELLQCFFDSKDESKYKGDIKARYFYEYLINTSNIRRLGLNATDISKKLKEKGFDKTPYVEATLMGKVYDWLHEDGCVTEESTIAYKFCPQVFTNAYVQAWKNPEEKVYLIIEEINRGNCAQIFGDLFQLLDRDKTGKSEYPIKADRDLAEYLRKVLAVTGCEGIEGGKLCLPSNLIIYATMNTSDQSLFPMDSAFKRRWDWEYVPIEYEAVKSDGKPNESYNYIITIDDEHKYRWVEFLKLVNEKIYDTTRSEDKQMGNFFIKESIGADAFVNKVMFYLWNEVCKEEYGTTRNFFRFAVEGDKDGKEFKFVDLFDKDKITNLLIGFMNHLKVGKYTE